jgi:hypothetical protein
MLQTVNGHAEINFGNGDVIILPNVASAALLHANDFVF